MGIRYPWAEGLNMGLNHSWGSGMSSRVATSQLKEARGMTFLIPTRGLNPYSSLRPMGNVYPYSIVVEANVWKCHSRWQKRGIYCRSDFSASGQQDDDFIWIKKKKLCNTIEMLKMSNFWKTEKVLKQQYSPPWVDMEISRKKLYYYRLWVYWDKITAFLNSMLKCFNSNRNELIMSHVQDYT